MLPATDPAYVAESDRDAGRCGIALLVPTIDPELPVLARSRAALKAIGCVAAVSDEVFVDIAADKLKTGSTFGGRGIAVPKSWSADASTANLPDPVFVKPRRGSASQGAGSRDASRPRCDVGRSR